MSQFISSNIERFKLDISEVTHTHDLRNLLTGILQQSGNLGFRNLHKHSVWIHFFDKVIFS